MAMNKKQTLLKVIRFVYDIFRSCIIILALSIGILYICGIRPYVVQTGSMEPTIPVNSLCFVNHNTDFDTIKSGDIIAFRVGENMLVTHRISGIAEGGFHTKGDANNTEDAAIVTAENFVGKTIIHIPKAGIVFFYLRTLWGKISFVLVGLLLVFIGNILENTEPKERSKNGKG